MPRSARSRGPRGSGRPAPPASRARERGWLRWTGRSPLSRTSATSDGHAHSRRHDRGAPSSRRGGLPGPALGPQAAGGPQALADRGTSRPGRPALSGPTVRALDRGWSVVASSRAESGNVPSAAGSGTTGRGPADRTPRSRRPGWKRSRASAPVGPRRPHRSSSTASPGAARRRSTWRHRGLARGRPAGHHRSLRRSPGAAPRRPPASGSDAWRSSTPGSASASGPTSSAGSGPATWTSSSGPVWRSARHSPMSASWSSTRSTIRPTRATDAAHPGPRARSGWPSLPGRRCPWLVPRPRSRATAGRGRHVHASPVAVAAGRLPRSWHRPAAELADGHRYRCRDPRDGHRRARSRQRRPGDPRHQPPRQRVGRPVPRLRPRPGLPGLRAAPRPHPGRNDAAVSSLRRRVPIASRCPSCESPRIRYLGGGTERIEGEVRSRFPTLRRPTATSRSDGVRPASIDASPTAGWTPRRDQPRDQGPRRPVTLSASCPRMSRSTCPTSGPRSGPTSSSPRPRAAGRGDRRAGRSSRRTSPTTRRSRPSPMATRRLRRELPAPPLRLTAVRPAWR